jgi:alpha-tubulin suppressor-like RCC1 family protein
MVERKSMLLKPLLVSRSQLSLPSRAKVIHYVYLTCAKYLTDILFDVVFSFGSAEKGQLGNGTTGERITTGNKTSYDIENHPGIFPFRNIYVFILVLTFFLVYLKELDGKNIVDIVSGQQHSLALDSTGFVSK